MTETIKVTELPDFDMAEHLKSDEDIANYLTLVLEENDASEFTHALGIIARARGMTEMACARAPLGALEGACIGELNKRLPPCEHRRRVNHSTGQLRS